MLSYVIVGSGYRAEYFGRIAGRYPDLFRAMFLCRSEEKAALMERHTGIRAAVKPGDALAFHPDFAVVTVDREHNAQAAEEWALRGVPVLAETPAGATLEQLHRLWELQERRGARIAVCEQYHRYPILAAGLRQVEKGVIGEPQSAYLSLCHDYHAASLLRKMLGTAGEGYTLRGEKRAYPLVDTDSRGSAVYDGQSRLQEGKTVHITFDSGKTAVYEFASVQYRTFLRSRHLVLRGSRGEWSDNLIACLDGENQPDRIFLMPDLPARYRVLDTQAFKDKRKAWQPEMFLDTCQDEMAIASMLLDMGDYLSGGPSPYALGEALEDAYFWLLMEEAVRHPWQETASQPMPWRRKG